MTWNGSNTRIRPFCAKFRSDGLMGGRAYVDEGQIGVAQSLKLDAVAAQLAALHDYHQEQIKCFKAFRHTRKLTITPPCFMGRLTDFSINPRVIAI